MTASDRVGGVTFAGFTCQVGEPLSTRPSQYQCLRGFTAAPNWSNNRLCLVNVTMPGRAFPPAPPQARPLPSFVSFSSARLIELSILFKRELFAVFDHCILGVWRVCFYDFNTLGNAFEAAAFAAPRIKRYVEIPFIGFRAAAGVV
jgi:hypothetical protein